MRITPVLICLILAAAGPLRAVVITNLVNTSDRVSFDFSGAGLGDFVETPPLTGWIIRDTFHGTMLPTVEPRYEFIFGIKHGTAPFFSIFGGGVFGIPSTGSGFVAHDDGFDSFFYTMNVQDKWTSFAGSLLVVHGQTAGIPDAGSTTLLAGMGLLFLGGVRRLLASKR